MECDAPTLQLYPASYYDSIEALVPRRQCWGTLLQDLRPLCVGRVWCPRKSKALGKRRLILQLPTDAALHRLAQAPDVILSRVDVALDLIAKDKVELDGFAEWVTPRLMKKWSRHPKRTVKGTTYSAPFEWGRSILAVYSDKPCRLDDTKPPCVHIEIRALGAEVVKRMGWSTVADLLNLDWRAFWAKHLLLKEPDLTAMRKQYRRHRPDADEQQSRRAVGSLMRVCQTEFLPPDAAALTGFCSRWSSRNPQGWLDARTAMKTLPVDHLLPPGDIY